MEGLLSEMQQKFQQMSDQIIGRYILYHLMYSAMLLNLMWTKTFILVYSLDAYNIYGAQMIWLNLK